MSIEVKHLPGRWVEELVVWRAGCMFVAGRKVQRQKSVDGFGFTRYPTTLQVRPF